MSIKPKLLGILYLSASFFYALLPLFWRVVPLAPISLVVHRSIFSFVTLGLVLIVIGEWSTVRDFSANVIVQVAKSALYLALHLAFFMGAIAQGYQVEAAIGIFLAPVAIAIVSVIYLKEKLNLIQYVCVAISVCAAMIFFHEAHQFPRFAIFIAVTHALYIFERKHALTEVNNFLAFYWLEQSFLVIPGILILTFHSVSAVNSQPFVVNGNVFLMLGSGYALETIGSYLQAKSTQIIKSSFLIGILGVISPVAQLGIAVLIDHKPVSLLQVIAIALLLIAVLLYNCPPLKSKVN